VGWFDSREFIFITDSKPVNQSVSLSFRYAELDYVHALRTHYASVLRLRLDIFIVVALTAIGSYCLSIPNQHWFGIVCISLAGSFSLLLLAAFLFLPRWIFRRELKLHDDYALTFSPDEIHFRTKSIDSHLQWSMYTRAIVDARSFLLYYGERNFTVIPKRVFVNAEQMQIFEQMLIKRVQQIVRQN